MTQTLLLDTNDPAVFKHTDRCTELLMEKLGIKMVDAITLIQKVCRDGAVPWKEWKQWLACVVACDSRYDVSWEDAHRVLGQANKTLGWKPNTKADCRALSNGVLPDWWVAKVSPAEFSKLAATPNVAPSQDDDEEIPPPTDDDAPVDLELEEEEPVDYPADLVKRAAYFSQADIADVVEMLDRRCSVPLQSEPGDDDIWAWWVAVVIASLRDIEITDVRVIHYYYTHAPKISREGKQIRRQLAHGKVPKLWHRRLPQTIVAWTQVPTEECSQEEESPQSSGSPESEPITPPVNDPPGEDASLADEPATSAEGPAPTAGSSAPPRSAAETPRSAAATSDDSRSELERQLPDRHLPPITTDDERIKTWSASGLSTFLTCGLAWKYRYIDKLPSKRHVNALKGRTGHAAIQADLEMKMGFGRLMEEEKLIQLAIDHFLLRWEDGVDLTEDELEEGEDAVRDRVIKEIGLGVVTFHNDVAPNIYPVALEHPFRVSTPFGATLRGYIDLVSATSVDDFKFTGKSPNQKEADNSLQITMYGLGARVTLGINPEQLGLIKIVTTKKTGKTYIKHLTTKRTEADYRRLLRIVKHCMDLARMGAFHPAPPDSWKCTPKFCDYWNHCPYGAKGRMR